ncbi:hypothetical protein [Bradyrhizobium elkanii]|jgi:hypothetical protein|uniref:hypothetical protein n=1 Tax=Bradyrhizobium elkanii TaxID=29448 RepID=UPI002714CCF7|nr:hypothetical protein [Bradyrhizobium elkanii]WLA50763.1 hypothetical protein QIH80_11610 [Bradyrhizobium elkanii]WLB78999.1 hypothetical protein QIH83_32405 [Bradyrhizobium elkanii]
MDMTYAFKLVISFGIGCFALLCIYWVWVEPIDFKKTLRWPLEKVVAFKDPVLAADIDVKQVALGWFEQNGTSLKGKLALIFYDLRLVNRSGGNTTIKDVHVRIEGQPDADSVVVMTGSVSTGQGGASETLLVRQGSANIFMMGWVNLRTVIGEYKPVPPGGVMSGSAVFVTDATPEQLKSVKSVQLVVRDFLENEATKDIKVDPGWWQGLDQRYIVSRHFKVDETGKMVDR